MVIMTFVKGVGIQNSSLLLKFSFFIAIFFLICKIYFDCFTKQEILRIFILIVLVIISYLFSRSESLVITLVTLIGMKNVSLRKVFRVTFWTRLVSYITTLLLAITGFISNVPIITQRNGIDVVRYGFGFPHPNLLHSSFFIMVCSLLLGYKERIRTFTLIPLLVLNYIIYQFSVSRTGYYVTLFVIVFFMIDRIMERIKNTNFIVRVMAYTYPILSIGTIIIATLYGRFPIFQRLDYLAFSGRLSFNAKFMTEVGITLFGKANLDSVGAIDNGYVKLLMENGIIFFLLFLFLYWFLFKLIRTSNNQTTAVILTSFFLYFIGESFLTNIIMNLTLYFFSGFIFNEKMITDFLENDSIPEEIGETKFEKSIL